jgi:23S rRNA (uracil-5-)-methyltransferase RumA
LARTLEVTPDGWLARGEAVAHRNRGNPMVVWGGIPGEAGQVRLLHKGSHQNHAEWVSAETPDLHRVVPPCDRYTPCGGCPLMHLDAVGQEMARRDLVRGALDSEGLRVDGHRSADGLGDLDIGAWHPSPGGLASFRHVVKVGFGKSDLGRVRMGAWGRNSREIVPIPQCTVAAPVLRKVMVSLAHHTIQLGIEPFNSGRGVLRAAILRASRSTGDVLVTLVAARRDPMLTELAEEIARGASEITGVWLHFNDAPGNALFARDAFGSVLTTPLVGREWIEERLGDVAYRIGPGDFFQTNPAMAEVLYSRVVELLDPTDRDAVLDLYCGVGGVALMAAKRAGFALGIEEIDGAVKRAKEAARINRVPAEFVAGSVRETIPEIAARLQGTGPKVVVDPARRGLEDGVADAILSLGPSRIAYVSCNPKALARDLAGFRARGWTIRPIELFDMFPNTPHVECVAILDPPTSETPTRRAPQRKLAR